MAFNDIFTNIFTLLQNDASLLPGILGPRMVNNMRIYRSFPNMQTFLTSYEPTQPAEGFLIIEEPMPALRMASAQVSSDHEFLSILFHVYGTTYAVTHEVLDVLDRLLHWTIPQQRDILWGDRWLLFARRNHEADKYEQNIKLYEKQVGYYLELVREEALPDA